jgi:hypothetical protein
VVRKVSRSGSRLTGSGSPSGSGKRLKEGWNVCLDIAAVCSLFVLLFVVLRLGSRVRVTTLIGPWTKRGTMAQLRFALRERLCKSELSKLSLVVTMLGPRLKARPGTRLSVSGRPSRSHLPDFHSINNLRNSRGGSCFRFFYSLGMYRVFALG